MKPAVGMAVLFHPVETQTHCAVIAEIQANGMLVLDVTPHGTTYRRKCVPLVQCCEAPPEFSAWCEWPLPVQQQARVLLDLPVRSAPPVAVTDTAIEAEIQAKGLTAPRVTPNGIEANIASEHYFTARDGIFGAHPGFNPQPVVPQSLSLLTFCILVLRNGFTVTGESACASPENFDAELDRKIARQNAVQKIWPLMGYELKSRLNACK